MPDTPAIGESLTRALLEAAPDAMLLADPDGRIVYANRRAEVLFGHPLEALCTLQVEDLMPERFRARHIAHRAAFARAARPRPMGTGLELFGLRRDGSEFPVEISLSVIADQGRRYFAAAVRDATERRQAERALRDARESLQRAQRVAHLGSFDWDLQNDHIARSPELYALFGLEPRTDEGPGWGWDDRVHPQDLPRVREVIDGAIAEGRDYRLEFRVRLSDTQDRWVLAQGEPTLEQGRPVRIVGTVQDITERKRAELAHEDSLHWLQAVLDQSPIGLLRVLGSPPERVELNAYAKRLVGGTYERVADYVGRVLTPDGTPLTVDQLPSARALRGERVSRVELLLRAANGRCIPVLASATRIRDASGRDRGAVVCFQDIAPLKELERLRAEWNSVVAHDLRQPIHAISLRTETLLRQPLDTPKVKHVEAIRASARRLNRMIDDLLDLSRLEARRLTLERRPADLAALARAAARDIGLQAPHRPIHLEVGTPLPEVRVDADRMAQILENLLTNAVKYGDPGTPITLRLDRDDGGITLSVTNRGPGIGSEQQAKLFHRFQRVAGQGPGGHEGIGLGLYITRALVEAHGGTLSLQSTPGQLTTFCVRLPLVPPQDGAAEPRAPAL
jgi:PAS domain S-box-containing protein